MRKTVLSLIFAVALFGQPTGVQVDLSVVSVDSSSGEVCFKADAWPDGAIFDVTDDHISVPDHADLDFDTTGDFTIEAWFKADAINRQNPIVCKLIGSNPNFTGYQMWIAPDNKLKAFICDGSYTLVASSSMITADTWYYAAFTVDRDGNEKLYLNGSLNGSPVDVSGVGNIDTDTCLWIGRATHSPSLAFDGTIAEVRISDVARSDAEIADAYALGGTFENDANTIALWHLNEGSGTAAGDSSGNGHDGIFIGAKRPGSGIEAALAFDGVDDYVGTPDTVSLNFDTTGDFTIEAWFKLDAINRQNPIVCKLIGSNPNFNGYQLWVAPDNKLKGFICDDSYTRVVSNSSISANNWYYAAFTVDRDGDEKLYLNGALDGTPVDVSGVGNIDTDMPLWLGRGTHSPSLALDGTIAEVRISNVVRSDAEIADAYTAGGVFENDANTIALWHLDEGAGTDIFDSSGNGHDATAISSEVYEPAVVLDGTDDCVTVPDHADLNFDTTGDFTIEAWFKADAVGRQNPIACKLVGSNPNFTGYQMWIAPDNKLKAFICDGSYTLVASSSTISANTWYYAAFTVDRDGNEKVYLNGALDCTPVDVSGVGNINTDTTLWIGRATHSPSLAFDGTIAEVRISDVARSDAEIADAYALGGTFENDANTIALWHLNEGSGTAAGDSSGNGHAGTLTNGAAWGDGVIVNPIQGATWTTGLLPTPPEFTYDYDWENDATYDLTDAGDSVCHTYTPGDSLWAMVKATTATYDAEDSAGVFVPEEEEVLIEPRLLFTLPISSGDTVFSAFAYSSTGKFIVNMFDGAIGERGIRYYDTTGIVIDSFPGICPGFGGGYSVSPDGHLVFIGGLICSDSLGVDKVPGYDPYSDYTCGRLYEKTGELRFETAGSYWFSRDGLLLGDDARSNVEGYDEALSNLWIIDTLNNPIFFKKCNTDDWEHLYNAILWPDFDKFWFVEYETLRCFDLNENLLFETPNMWGDLVGSGCYWRPLSGNSWERWDSENRYWRIGRVYCDSLTSIAIVAYDTAFNKVRSFSIDGSYEHAYLDYSGDYFWASKYNPNAEEFVCGIFSGEDGTLLEEWDLPISFKFAYEDTLRNGRSRVEWPESGMKCKYFSPGKGFAAIRLKYINTGDSTKGQRVRISDPSGAVIFEHNADNYTWISFSSNVQYMIFLYEGNLYAYKLWERE